MKSVFASILTIVDSKKNLAVNSLYEFNGFTHYENMDNQNHKFKRHISMTFQSILSNKLSTKLLDELKKIINLCQQNQIKLILFISPSHATQWEIIRISDQWSTFEEWKREVVKITPVFDFSGYNSITSEPIYNGMENYRDNSHYTKKVGDLVLNRILDYKEEEVPDDLGILINPENIESHLEKIRQDREFWAKNNPDEVNLVKEIKQKSDASLN